MTARHWSRCITCDTPRVDFAADPDGAGAAHRWSASHTEAGHLVEAGVYTDPPPNPPAADPGRPRPKHLWCLDCEIGLPGHEHSSTDPALAIQLQLLSRTYGAQAIADAAAELVGLAASAPAVEVIEVPDTGHVLFVLRADATEAEHLEQLVAGVADLAGQAAPDRSTAVVVPARAELQLMTDAQLAAAGLRRRIPPGTRQINGDTPGTIVTCDRCDGDGVLHVPDHDPGPAPTPDPEATVTLPRTLPRTQP